MCGSSQSSTRPPPPLQRVQRTASSPSTSTRSREWTHRRREALAPHNTCDRPSGCGDPVTCPEPDARAPRRVARALEAVTAVHPLSLALGLWLAAATPVQRSEAHLSAAAVDEQSMHDCYGMHHFISRGRKIASRRRRVCRGRKALQTPAQGRRHKGTKEPGTWPVSFKLRRFRCGNN